MGRAKDPRDAQVGKRIKFFRLQAGLSQTVVGDALGITFQQIQKYELGSNRVGPSRLLTMAKLFKVEVGEFFGNDKPGGDANSFDVAVMNTPRRLQIVKLLVKRNDERIEDIIIDMLKHHVTLAKRARNHVP